MPIYLDAIMKHKIIRRISTGNRQISRDVNCEQIFIFQLFVGLGFPYEGPAPLEAIANGCFFLNVKLDPPLGKFDLGSSLISDYENKRTIRYFTCYDFFLLAKFLPKR